MSKLKIKNWYVLMLVALLSMFLVGCNSDTPVDSISFDLGSDSQIVMLVDQELDLNPMIDVRPKYASNKTYTISSSNTEVITVSGSKITALSEGESVIRVVSKSNSKKEDMMTVIVKKSVEKLSAPRNLQLDVTTQSLTFDAVDNASTYMIQIGSGENISEYELGSSNKFELKNYPSETLNTVLTARVRANPSVYSYAYSESDYSGDYKFYQNKPITDLTAVGGELRFNNDSSKANIFINGELYSTTENNIISLVGLPSKYAGQNITVGVKSVLDETIKSTYGSDVKYFDSKTIETNIHVLGAVNASMVSTTVSWDHVAYATGYKIYLDDKNIVNGKMIGEDLGIDGTVAENYFDLATLDEFDSMIISDKISKIKLIPTFDADTKNVGSSNTTNELSVSRLSTPIFALDENKISWSGVDNASTYTFTITIDGETTVASIRGNEYSFTGYNDAESFDITIRANSSGEVAGVYYLYSDERSITVEKFGATPLRIEDYQLVFDSVKGYSYRINFFINEELQDRTIEVEAVADTTYVDLSNYDFSVGTHEVSLTRLGNGENSINSVGSSVSFTQLEAVGTLAIENGVTKVTLPEETIVDATNIQLRTVIDGETRVVNNLEWAYNTIDENEDNYLPAGEYTTYLYVCGDGSSTFSYRENVLNAMTEVPVAELSFTVLDIPYFITESMSKDSDMVKFQTIEGASYKSYKLEDGEWKILKEFTTDYSYYNFALNPGETATVKLQAIGDGITTLNSHCSQEITATKLINPEWTYNNQSNEFNLTKYDPNTYYNLFIFNQVQVSDLEMNLRNGWNRINIQSISIDGENNHLYFNSKTVGFVVDKIYADTLMSIENNELIISPKYEHDREYSLEVKFTFGEEIKVFKSNNGLLTCDGYNSLPYRYDQTNISYHITLLDEDHKPLISEMLQDFDIEVKYIPKLGETKSVAVLGTSDYSNKENKKLDLLDNPVLTRVGQKLQFDIDTSRPTYSIDNYKIVANDSIKINLSDVATYTDPTFTIDALALLERLGTDVYDIRVEVNPLDTEENLMSAYSNTVTISRASTVLLSYTKDNTIVDNSGYITMNSPELNYNRRYILEMGGVTRIINVDELVDNCISIRLDDQEMAIGENTVFASVETDDRYVDSSSNKTVEVFNSKKSNTLTINKLSTPTPLYTRSGILHFEAISGAIGYEIYEYRSDASEGYSYTKLNTNLLTEPKYTLDLNPDEDITIVVKAISDTYASNSSYSSEALIRKVADPIIEIIDGHLSVTNIEELEGANITLNITNRDQLHAIGVYGNGVSIDPDMAILEDDTLIAYADKVLTYPYSDLTTAEKLTFSIDISYPNSIESNIYYLNSNSVEMNVYGLFAPQKVKKVMEQDSVEFLSWEASTKNIFNDVVVQEGYIFEISYTNEHQNTVVYRSNDPKLKFKQGENFESYGIIPNIKTKFPYGYDDDGDGECEIVFGAGKYDIAVQAVPKINGNNLCASQFSSVYSFTIMSKPVLTAYDGFVEWGEDTDATSYEVVLTQGGTVIEDVVYTNSYHFTHQQLANMNGLFTVTVKAISTKANVINSDVSDEIMVYRLAKATNLVVDDGYIKFDADRFFTLAKITITDKGNQSVIVTELNNKDKAKQELTLGVRKWNELTGEALNNLTQMKTYVISDDQLKAMSGRSYSVSVELIGQSSTLGAFRDLMLINSVNSGIFDLTAVKLTANTYSVATGQIKFSRIDDQVKMNYNFNSATDHGFWQNTYIYKIIFTTPTDTHAIYAVDYYTFVEAINAESTAENYLDSTDYQIYEDNGEPTQNDLYARAKYSNGVEDIYFNVYRENMIDLASYDEVYYHRVNQTITDGTISYTGDISATEIDLSTGGSFYVDIYVLGGDQYLINTEDTDGNAITTNIGYLTAVNTDLRPFVRYGDNSLSTYEGCVQFNNLMQYREEEVIDYPVYKLSATSVDGTVKKVIYYYVYEKNLDEEYAERVVRSIAYENDKEIIDDPEYVDNIIYLTGPLRTGMSDTLIVNLAKYVDSSKVYSVTIRTLAGIGHDEEDESNYLLNAKAPSSSTQYFKYSTPVFRVNNSGLLETDMSYITIDGSNNYAKKYEITLYDNDAKVDNIIKLNTSEVTEGVTYDYTKHLITYNLPSVYNSSSYSISARALSNENFVLNGTYPEDAFTFARAGQASNIRIEDGELRWRVEDLDNYTETYIKVTYEENIGDVMYPREIVFSIEGTKATDGQGNYTYHSYKYLDQQYLDTISNSKVWITEDINYKLSVMVVGNPANDMIHSGYGESIDFTRLGKVNSKDIVADNGILSWTEVAFATRYTIDVIGSDDTYRYTVEDEDPNVSITNSLDFSTTADSRGRMLPAGEYSITIRAIGTDIVTGMISDTVSGFEKLAMVDNLHIDSNFTLTWNEIEGATHYWVGFEYTDDAGVLHSAEENAVIIEGTTTTAPIEVVGIFTAYVRAVGYGYGNKIFSGEKNSYTTSTEIPDAVGSIGYDELNNRYFWQVHDNYLETDIFNISYSLATYTSEGMGASIPMVDTVTITSNPENYFVDEEGNTYCSYPLSIMGKYTEFTVYVTRLNTTPSPMVNGVDKDLNYYQYGNGKDIPYAISNIDQLLNIKHYATRNANFRLIASINLDEVSNIEELLAENYDESIGYTGLISAEFNGVLDGYGSNIYASEINLNGVNQFALFGKLDSATIKNITFGIRNNDNLEKNGMTLLNSFANDVENVVQLSLIATGANNSIIEDVDIIDLVVVLSGEGTIKGDVYIAGLIVEDNGTIFRNTSNTKSVSIYVEIETAFGNNTSFIGGLVAKSKNTSVTDYNVDFTLEVSKDTVCSYVGGIIGYFEGQNNQEIGVIDSTIVINAENISINNFGGVAGYAKFIKIDNCEVSGTIKNNDLMQSSTTGGLVGLVQSSVITNNIVDLQLDIQIVSQGSQWLGLLVGSASISSSVACTISGNNVGADVNELTTIAQDNTITLGLSGYKANGLGTIS